MVPSPEQPAQQGTISNLGHCTLVNVSSGPQGLQHVKTYSAVVGVLDRYWLMINFLVMTVLYCRVFANSFALPLFLSLLCVDFLCSRTAKVH